eukprot:6192794-Pleurochrysis_carterae.AAC.2
MDIDARPRALEIVSLAPLYFSFRKEFMLEVLPMGIPKEINVSFFSIQPGSEADPVLGSMT